ncbi:Crooked neck-like protein 1 [Ranunculus cassubicifolius]
MASSSSFGFVKLPRATRVKNKAPATIQITAEQILREARSIQQSEFSLPKQKINDSAELAEYQLATRKQFERRVRQGNKVWIRYAEWEASQNNFKRTRSVYERALLVDYRNQYLWLNYAEFEMRNKFINHARNVWDRAISLLPRIDQLWYKYIHMEEMLGNVSCARQIFERWMTWMPDTQAWLSYIKFELRYNEINRARLLYKRFVQCHPEPGSWIRFAKFEMKNKEIGNARECYQAAIQVHQGDEKLFLAFAEFEESCKEIERARCIYKFALDHVPKGEAQGLYKKYVTFEKQFGDKHGIEDSIVGHKRFQYEEEVSKSPLSYDTWFDYIRLEENNGNLDNAREIYEKAIANVPPAEEKRLWKRYIYLWISYALFEELDAQDSERARDAYKECLKLIPHHKFSFSKIWILAAQFEIRQKNLEASRKVLGNAIGRAPKDKIFKKYIEIEMQLGNIDRCRTLYEKYLQWAPAKCYAWCKYAEFEQSLSEIERARAILELAIAQPALDMPELLWKTYIDFELSQGEYEKSRQLYERLLGRTKHLKVWISYARFEATANNVEQTRKVFERALNYYRTTAPELKEERAMLLEEWLNAETGFGANGDVSLVQNKLPKKLKKRKEIVSEAAPCGYMEYYDYVFPEETTAPNLKILEAAYKWKKQKLCT